LDPGPDLPYRAFGKCQGGVGGGGHAFFAQKNKLDLGEKFKQIGQFFA